VSAPADGETRGPGRPRDPNLEARVFAAALAIYAEAGWSGFSFDAVARRAGVGRAPLYLRWQSKEDLLLAALSAHSRATPLRGGGSLRDDLIEYATRLLASKSDPEGWAFQRIQLEATVNPALHTRFSSEVAVPHIDAARAVLHQAVERGDLPAETPVDLVLATLYGAIFSQVTVTDDPRQYAEYVVDFVLGRALATASP
jgi:AcrR family transcriptional regulator